MDAKLQGKLEDRLADLRRRIRACEKTCGREPESVRLVAVSKTRPATDVQEAYQAGQVDFGENYLQEALHKQQELTTFPLVWHFIGPIQSNKTRAIAEHFSWVHSLDRLKIAQRLSEQRPSRLPALKVLIQVNLSEEDSKAGISLEELPAMARQIGRLPGLVLSGLMAIPAPVHDAQAQRPVFRRLREARDTLLDEGLDTCRELSMGMSADFEAAIAEGATMIRIGTDIFGPRNHPETSLGTA